MADPQQYKFLLGTLGQGARGRKSWLDFKEKARWIDLCTADLSGRSLVDYDFSEANLSTAILLQADLMEADFSDAVLTYADLRRANLRQAVLDRANLQSANLQGANLTDACLEGAKLVRAKLNGAILTGGELSGADLSGADLRGATLKFARLTGANLTGANVAEADLTGAVMDDQAVLQMHNFDLAVIDDRKYRELRSRLTNLSHMPEQAPPRAAEESTAGARAATHPPGNGGSARAEGNGARAGAEAASPIEADSIPLRQREPDLTSPAGCSEVLGVPNGAPLPTIINAFRDKAKLYHPDKVRHLSARLQELAAEEFRRVRMAYEMLTRVSTRPLSKGINWPEDLPRYPTPYDYSIEQYEQLARLNPSNTNLLYNLAWKYFEEGRYAEAQDGFLRVLALNPKDEDAQYNIIIVRMYSEILLPGLGYDGGKGGEKL